MVRYAFVDVHNTEGTAHKLYGFSVDWHKLCRHLGSDWNCRKVFFYAGIEDGDDETAKEFDSLGKLDCSVVRTKPIKIYKKPNRKVEVQCSNCGNANVAIVEMGYDKKGNCDVDLTIDALENAGPDTEYYIFTGDGDFEPLITEALGKGVAKVHVVSSGKAFIRAGVPNKRLATKLKSLFKKHPGVVDLIDIASLKFKIKRDLLPSV
jgi:uncharacterized LabA/DUF88 family protein